MKLAMIGVGYVGLVSGACFSEFGFDVICVDNNQDKVARLQAGEIPIYEPGLEDLVKRNADAGRLVFTTDLGAAVRVANAVFITVGTPSDQNGREIDLSYIYAAADLVASHLRPGTVVVIKSTVAVGTCRQIWHRITKAHPELGVEVASNPEFLREGSAITDFIHPDRVVIGVETANARSLMAELYRPLRNIPVIFTGLENAELIKYATNAFLALKITFINEIANLCENVGSNVQEVAYALGADKRIGPKFLEPGPGFGGSCLPKDTRALVAIGKNHHTRQTLVEAAIAANEQRKKAMAERIITIANQSSPDSNKTIAILGLAYKPETDDVREAASLTIIPLLQQAGFVVRATDPKAIANAQAKLTNVTWCRTAYEAATGADVTVIMTEWNAYRGLNLKKLAKVMSGDILLDLRNIYRNSEVGKSGLKYNALGL